MKFKSLQEAEKYRNKMNLGEIVMKKDDFIKEHKKLIKLLLEAGKEGKKQAMELKKKVGGRKRVIGGAPQRTCTCGHHERMSRITGGKLIDCPPGFTNMGLTCTNWNTFETIGRVDIPATNDEIKKAFDKLGSDIKKGWDDFAQLTENEFKKLGDDLLIAYRKYDNWVYENKVKLGNALNGFGDAIKDYVKDPHHILFLATTALNLLALSGLCFPCALGATLLDKIGKVALDGWGSLTPFDALDILTSSVMFAGGPVAKFPGGYTIAEQIERATVGSHLLEAQQAALIVSNIANVAKVGIMGYDMINKPKTEEDKRSEMQKVQLTDDYFNTLSYDTLKDVMNERSKGYYDAPDTPTGRKMQQKAYDLWVQLTVNRLVKIMALRPKANDKIKDNEYFLKSIQDGFTEKKIVEGIRKMIPASEQSPPKPEEPEDPTAPESKPFVPRPPPPSSRDTGVYPNGTNFDEAFMNKLDLTAVKNLMNEKTRVFNALPESQQTGRQQSKQYNEISQLVIDRLVKISKEQNINTKIRLDNFIQDLRDSLTDNKITTSVQQTLDPRSRPPAGGNIITDISSKLIDSDAYRTLVKEVGKLKTVQAVDKKIKEIKQFFEPDYENYPVKSKKTLDKYGNDIITGIELTRTTLGKPIKAALEALSLGTFDEARQKAGYDEYFHLQMIVSVKSAKGHTKKITIQKNERIIINDIISGLDTSTEYKIIPLQNKVITMNEMLEKTRLKDGDLVFFGYDGFNNRGLNCQSFIKHLLENVGLWTDDIKKFTYQDLTKVIESIPDLGRDIINFVPALGNWFSKVTGQGLTEAERKGKCDLLKGMTPQERKDLYWDIQYRIAKKRKQTASEKFFIPVLKLMVEGGDLLIKYSKLLLLSGNPELAFIGVLANAYSYVAPFGSEYNAPCETLKEKFDRMSDDAFNLVIEEAVKEAKKQLPWTKDIFALFGKGLKKKSKMIIN
jgi:hypothetical protein